MTGFVKVTWKKHVQANIRIFWKHFPKKSMWIQERPQHTAMPLSNATKMEKICSGKTFGALLTDLSKAFDCLDHEIHDYLSHRKHRTRVNNPYSEWLAVVFGVPQGSILASLLFNIFLADLFLILSDTDIKNFADDNTPYHSAKNVDVIESQYLCSNGLKTTFWKVMLINAIFL